MQDPAPASGNNNSAQKQRMISVVLLPGGVLAIVVGLFMVLAGRGGGRADPSAIVSGFVLLLIGSFLVNFGLRFLIAGSGSLSGVRLRRGLVTTEDYDHPRYDIFKDALDAVSLGMGLDAPMVVVAAVPQANSFNSLFGGKRVVAVTPLLLSAELTQAEVEAVMAVAAAKQVHLQQIDHPGFAGDQAGLCFDDIQWGIDKKEIQVEVWRAGRQGEDSLYRCTTVLNEDTLAARTTGQPAALASAIGKVASLLERDLVRMITPLFSQAGPVLEGYWVAEDLVFVTPPLVTGVWNAFRQKMREVLIRLRLENLEAIEAGMRKPHEVIRDGKPLVEPEAWR